MAPPPVPPSSGMVPRPSKSIVLFDLDGTLTPARKPATPEMLAFLHRLRSTVTVGIISGSDQPKVEEQLGSNGLEDAKRTNGIAPDAPYDWLFVENGVVAYERGNLVHKSSLALALGEELVQEVINCTLRYFSEIDLPVKRGTFIEYRTGMLNLSPIGRSCSYEETLQFFELDKKEKIRDKFVAKMRETFDDKGLQFSIGGQISVDCFPKGWDKRYCLQFLEKEFGQIHFFGDKTKPGGNDYEIYEDPRTIGHTVVSPEDTIEQLKQLFNITT